MRIAAIIAGVLLGLIFVAFPGAILSGALKMPAPPAGSAAALFWGAMAPTGYLKVIQVLQILGGILVAIPLTRNWGLLILGPMVVNILLYHLLIQNGEGLVGPPLVVALLSAFLLFVERRAFFGLLGSARV